MDQELREYLDKQFKSIDERFRESAEQLQVFRKETNERFERVESGVRENRVLIEGLEGKIQLVAEGVANVDSKLERFKGEVAQEIKDVRATMNLHDSELDRRLKKLEKPRRSPLPSARKRPSPKAARSR